jgi:predicted nucleotidyltransferase
LDDCEKAQAMKHHGLEIPRDALRDFCRKHRIRRLSLFGSVLRADFSPASDVDVLVEFEPNARVGLQFFEIERELSRLLGRRVDLNTLGFLSKYFRDEVLAQAEVQYDAA